MMEKTDISANEKKENLKQSYKNYNKLIDLGITDIKKGVSKENSDVQAFLRQGKAGTPSETKKSMTSVCNFINNFRYV